LRISGILIVLIAVAVPLPWFWALAAKHDAAAIASQYIGSVALILMGLSQLLATRWIGLETLFGGLDRIYILHKWLGITAMAAVLLHDTIDAEVDGIGRETLLTDVAETMGEISLYGFLILVVLSIATFVPYHLWKYTHKLMGAFFAASAFHYAFIIRPFPLSDPLGAYVLSFCILGIVCYLYTLVPFTMIQGRHAYTVRDLKKTGGALAISLKAVGSGIRHRPGQFATISIGKSGLEEPHPFTISSAPADGNIRFTVKPLGDYTSRLIKQLQVGDRVRVSGGFGHFSRRKGSGTEIWIAGGIGITPFLAYAEAIENSEQEIHLFHCVRNPHSAPHSEELETIAEQHPNFNYHLIDSSTRGRLAADEILETTKAEIADLRVYFCGPEAMRTAMASGFRKCGLRAARFYYEEFEIRSGVGLRKALGLMLPRLLPKLFPGTAR